jgi:hypothetical protein
MRSINVKIGWKESEDWGLATNVMLADNLTDAQIEEQVKQAIWENLEIEMSIPTTSTQASRKIRTSGGSTPLPKDPQN